jgi:prevent-host-death family protein
MVTTMTTENLPKQTTVSLYEAKTHLSELGARAAAGEEIVVTKHGKPTFRMVPVEHRRRPLPGSFPFSRNPEERAALESIDWFAPDEELERLWGTRE